MNLPEKFDGRSRLYVNWRATRLEIENQLQVTPVGLSTHLSDNTDEAALAAICNHVDETGYALYEWIDAADDINKSVKHLHTELCLTQSDHGIVADEGSLSLLKDMSGSERGKFIPYTSRAMGWHTDGYYNDQHNTVRCFTLHCISPASSGGELSLIDDELLFIALNDEDPDLVALLSHPKAMTLPANKDNLGHDRPDRCAAVFSCHSDGCLVSRFTTRTKNIHWRNEETFAAAVRATEVLNTMQHHTTRLTAGQGIVTRNILHRREAFNDAPDAIPRQMLRGRYMQKPALRPQRETGTL